MAVFTIADLHLSFGTDKPMQVFAGWHDYEDRLKSNWLDTVSDNDTVVIVGDISWAMNLEQALPDFKFIDLLPGEKLIIKGNHDYWWTTVKKMNSFLSANELNSIKFLHNNSYERDGIAICGTRGWLYNQPTAEDKKLFDRELIRLEASLKDSEGFEGEKVAFLHYPPVFGGVACLEISDLLEKYGVKRCYFGHIHTKTSEVKEGFVYRGIVYKLISSVCADFAPVKVL